MRSFWLAAILMTALLVPQVSVAWIHVARDGQTLEQLASHYYGSPDKAIVIRAANGFMHPDDGSVLQGERVEIPGVTYHKVKEGENWYSLANRHLGSSKRAAFLAELNDRTVETTLEEGKVVKIPYQLLYIFAPEETLKSITKLFLGKYVEPKWLKTYNLRNKKKYGRGDAILVPLIDVEYTAVAKKEMKTKTATEATKLDKKAQVEAVAHISRLRDAYAEGKYLEIITMGQRLLSTQTLTNPQQLGVYKYIAFAYIAYGDEFLASAAFANALTIQPSMELSPITVSPKVLKVFREVQKKMVSK